MGYRANGDGSVVFKDEVNREKVIELLNSLPRKEIEFELYDEGVDLREYDTHWNEENIFRFLEALVPYITDGYMNYSGDEDCIWRYKFNPDSQSWDKEYAVIDYNFESYSDDDLINELTRRGYKILL